MHLLALAVLPSTGTGLSDRLLSIQLKTVLLRISTPRTCNKVACTGTGLALALAGTVALAVCTPLPLGTILSDRLLKV